MRPINNTKKCNRTMNNSKNKPNSKINWIFLFEMLREGSNKLKFSFPLVRTFYLGFQKYSILQSQNLIYFKVCLRSVYFVEIEIFLR